MSNSWWAVKFTLFVAVLVLWSQCGGIPALAEAAPPGWANVTAGPVSPEAAESYYSKRTSLTAPEVAAASATEQTPEITELARGLLHDPKLIYDYVHNHIDYVPYYGSLKGATLTYLDGSGNDFDQASLMIALLRASGLTAQYQYGTMDLDGGTGSPLANWVGSSNNYASILASGGVPLTWAGTHYDVTRVWVKATIGGTDYGFDPAYKTYTTASKIDIGQALGYSRSDLLAAAGGTVAPDGSYVQNLNEPALAAKLTQYAMNFVNTIRTQHPNDSIDEILGRRSVDQTELTSLPTALPFPATVTATWDEVPASHTATLRIQHAGIDQTLQTANLAGGRLTITYASGDHHPELRLDGTLIASGYATTNGSLYDMTLTVDHPYAAYGGTYCDQSTTYQNKSGATYAIIYNFGGNSEAIISKRQKQADEFIADGLPADSEPARGEALNIAGLSWLRQVRLAGDLACGLWDVVEITHHRVGRMAQEAGCYIDVATAVSSTVPKVYGSSNGMAVFYSVTTMASGMEHAVVEQSIPNSQAVSTVKCLQIANSRGQKIFRATCANFDSVVRPQLQNYTASELNNFRNRLCSGQVAWFLLPQDGSMLVDSWRGTGYVERSGVGDSLGMIIYGGLSGGYCTEDGCVIFLDDLDLWLLEDPSLWGWDDQEYSEEPVEMSNGAYTHNHTDLSLGGSAPLGVAFSRSYNSGRNTVPSPLGFGWTHSLDLRLTTSSDPAPPLGGRLPCDAGGLIAALYATLDLHGAEDNARGWTLAALIDKWATDLLIGNSASVRLGGKVMPYIRLADGTYQAPPGVVVQLVDNHDGTHALVERFGTRINFGTDGNAVSLVDVDGNAMAFTYTGGVLTRVQDAFGRSITPAYSGGRMVSVSDSAGRTVSFGYDSGGNLATCTDPENKVWHYAYDGRHRMTGITNPLGITTITNTYDSLGRASQQVAPRQGGTNATYNFYFSGYRNVEEDPLAGKTVYFYDGESKLLRMQDALGNRTSRRYDGQGHVTESVDARGNRTIYAYDGNGSLTGLTNPRLESTTYDYDSLFRLTTTTDPAGHATSFGYDARHHLTLAVDAEGNQVSNAYFPNGLKNTTTDARGAVTTLAYNPLGQLNSSRVGNHPPVTYAHDVPGNLTQLTDQVGSSAGFIYDRRSLATLRTDALSRNTSYVYDDAGQLESVTDRNGQTITYTYTPTGKLQQITPPGSPPISFTYDSRDNRVSMQDSLGTTIYAYDAMNRLWSITDPRGFAVSYTYDSGGNVATLTYPGNKIVSYGYDELNRLETVTNWLGQTATYSYDVSGQLGQLVNFNGTVTTYAHDRADRLTGLENRTSSTSAIATYQFTLDGGGNRTQSRQSEPLMTAPETSSCSYDYNAPQRNRLLAACGRSFNYDLEGQLAGVSGTAYTFDSLHRLVYVGGASPCSYLYDGQGRRLQATRGGVVTRYVYDAGGNVLAEADASNNITAYYVHGAGLLARVTPAGSTLCYHFNSVGSTIAMTDQSQNVVNKYAYDPFGNITSQSETAPQPFKFVGQFGVMAEPNGLYYMRARYYDAQVGRFVSEDPIGLAGGDVNLYAYAGGNPFARVDPSGKVFIVPMLYLYAGFAAWYIEYTLAPYWPQIYQGLYFVAQAPWMPPGMPEGAGGVIGFLFWNVETIGNLSGQLTQSVYDTLMLSWSGWQMLGGLFVDWFGGLCYDVGYWWFSQESGSWK